MSEKVSRHFVLLCGDGSLHVEHGEAPSADNRQCAQDAADFMDKPREAGLGWSCGPHSVVQR